MKALKNKIALMSLFLGLGSLAIATNGTNDPSTFASKTIKSKIILPDNLKKAGFHEKVKMIFTVNDKCEVNHVIAVTNNPELKASLEKQFIGLSFDGFKTNGANSVVLNFNVY
jgi:hypothetical protein